VTDFKKQKDKSY